MFAAVVNDYGRFGEVIELRSGRVTMTLDNHGYQEHTFRSRWPSPATTDRR